MSQIIFIKSAAIIDITYSTLIATRLSRHRQTFLLLLLFLHTPILLELFKIFYKTYSSQFHVALLLRDDKTATQIEFYFETLLCVNARESC